MAKKSYQVMQLINEEVSTKTKYIIQVPTRGTKSGQKIKLRKYDPVTRQHHMFVTKKMPSHSK